MEKTHPNDTPLTQTGAHHLNMPQSELFPILKRYVVNTRHLSEDNTVVVGFSVSDGNIKVQCEVGGDGYAPQMPEDEVRKELDLFIRAHLGIHSVNIEKWHLVDKKNPYLVVIYVINAVGEPRPNA